MNTPLSYLAKNGIIIGECYNLTGCGYDANWIVTGVAKNKYNEWCVVFANKVTHPMVHSWSCKMDIKPIKVVAVVEDHESALLDHDSRYSKLSKRHSELCGKKLRMNEQGKNTTMRNAYINQELEVLRAELRKYKSAA